MPVSAITEQTFEAEVLQSQLPVLLEFGAEWCGPCKVTAPELEAVSQELAGKLKVATVDIDKSPLLARQFGVQSVPAFVVIHEGRPLGGRVGAMNRKQLREMVEPILPRPAGALKAKELAKLIELGKVTPVDIREEAVWKRKHLPKAVNFPAEDLPNRLAELHMLAAPPVLYCRGGDVSATVAQKLNDGGLGCGYLEGGVLEWEGSGFELER
jgi:thioredoxin 1/putative thioredoxin